MITCIERCGENDNQYRSHEASCEIYELMDAS